MLDCFTHTKILAVVNPAGIATSFMATLCGVSLVLNFRKILRLKPLMSLNFGFLLFFFAIALSLINSDAPATSLSEFIRLQVLFLFFNYVAITFRHEKALRLILRSILLSSLIPLAFGAYQIIYDCGNLETHGFNRIYGTFVHPNVMAQYLLLITFLIFFYATTYSKDRWKRYGLTLFLFLVLLEVYHTFTRSVWVALVAGILIFFFIRNKPKQYIRNGLAFIIILVLSLPFISERWKDVFQKKEQAHLSSWEWRTQLWERMIERVQEHPFTGFSFGMFDHNVGCGAHNDFLRILYETGFFGFGMYLLFLMFFVFIAAVGLCGTRPLFVYNKYKLIISLMLAIFLVSFGDNFLRNTVVMFYYFCTFALMLNVHEHCLPGAQHEKNPLS